MAISIKQIPVLKGSTAMNFVANSSNNIKKAKTVEFKKEIQTAKKILSNAKF